MGSTRVSATEMVRVEEVRKVGTALSTVSKLAMSIKPLISR